MPGRKRFLTDYGKMRFMYIVEYSFLQASIEICERFKMKRTFVLFLSILWIELGAVNIFSESFQTPPNLPVGWTLQSDTPAEWSVSSTNYTGGTPGALQLYYTPHSFGVHRCITPAFNASRAYDLGLSFRHVLSDWNVTAITYILKVEISFDLIGWTTLQSWSVDADIPATEVSINIPYLVGRSATTYLSFTFEGDNNDINHWQIDDVLVSSNNTLGRGLWNPGTYNIDGDLMVPQGETLQLQPGSELRFSGGNGLHIYGRLLSIGSEAQPVVFTEKIYGTGWQGISLTPLSAADSTLFIRSIISESNTSGLLIGSGSKIRVQNCLFYGNNVDQSGGGINCQASGAKIFDCEFSHNTANLGGGIYSNSPGVTIRNCDFNFNLSVDAAAMFCSNNTGIIAGNVFHENYSDNSIVEMNTTDLNGFNNNSFYQNSGGLFACALYTFGCSGEVANLLIYDNSIYGVINHSSSVSYSHATIVNGADASKIGIIFSHNLLINNSIFHGYTYCIENNSAADNLIVRYSCIQNGVAGIGSNGVLSENYIGCISLDPQFRDAESHDYGLFFSSPCVDSGDPETDPDADGSRADMGFLPCAYQINPILFEAKDVFPDQGHRLHLAWARSSSDATYNPQSYYSVWRQAQSRRPDAVIINDPRQIANLDISRGQQVCWNDGTRYWDYVIQVPALTQPVYGLVVETLADSSASGLNAVDFRIIYANQVGFWASDALSGYSLDNIPPNPARNLALMPASANRMLLCWEEVNEGSWEGNSYPELNQISYKVYGDINPDFDPGPQNYLGTTTNIQLLINHSGNARMFFRIVCSDSQ